MKRLVIICLSVAFLMVSALIVYVGFNQQPDRSVESLSERWAQPPSQFMNLAGMQVHVRDEGLKSDPVPLVLLHGTSASLHTWDGWVRQLGEQHRIIRFDLPAFGLTGPSPVSDYTIESYTDFVIAVLDEMQIDTFTLAGNSLGGYISWATAVRFPQRVNSLVLVDASGYQIESKSAPIAFRIAQTPFISSLLKSFMPRAIVDSSVRNVFGDPTRVTDKLVDRYFELNTRQGNRQALVERFKQTQPGEMAKRVSEITVPTLIIWGGKDRLIPAMPSAQRFNREIPQSELLIFEQLGHVPHEEGPVETAAAVSAFLQAIPR